MYDRAALILDTENHPLGGLSLALITLGVRPLYTTELDELVLLSREYRSQVGAVLLPSSDVAERLPSVRKRVLEPLGLALSGLVPVGDPLAPDLADPLRAEGVRYRLPVKHEPHELRFVVTSAMSLNDCDELRLGPRVPCELPVSVESQHRTVEGSLTDLSMSGAFVSMAHPFARDTEVKLRFAIVAHNAALRARVSWRVEAKSPAWRDRGMGVEFVDVGEATGAALQRFVAVQTDRFRF